jgi:tetratricopeptide (TPR) repeat protein
MATNWKIGDRIQNRWEIHNILGGPGKSGMGIVYVVYDHEYGFVHAAKTFQDEVFASNLRIAERFIQESLNWVNLDAHPNIAQASFVKLVGDKPFVFVEYFSEGDLSRWIGTPRLTENLPQVLRFAIQLCDGMTHALIKGIKAHRDLKPQNCLIGGDDILKISDFGLAKTVDDISHFETETPGRSFNLLQSRTGLGAGTPWYMSPEQFDDAKHVDVRADIYSLGVILFQMVSGELPFTGNNWDELKHKHKTLLPPQLDLPQTKINYVIQTCLAKLPSDRFKDFQAAREELAACYEELTGITLQPPKLEELNALQLTDKATSLENLGYREEALVYFDLALKSNPDLAHAWINKGYTLAKLHRIDEAFACYDTAEKLQAQSDALLINRGQALFLLRRNEEALACFEAALEFNRHNSVAWTNKASVLSTLGKHEEALPCSTRALELDPHSDHAWYTRSVSLFNLGHCDEARKGCERVVELNSRYAEVWTLIGELEKVAGNVGEELACYDHAIEINPKLADAWARKAHELAVIQRLEEALVCANRATELDPDDNFAWFCKGNVLLMMRQIPEALHCFKEADRLGSTLAANFIQYCSAGPLVPWYPEFYLRDMYMKGVQLMQSERLPEALLNFSRVLEMDRQLKQAWLNKGFVLAKLGRVAEGMTYIDRALEMDPDYAQAHFTKGTVLVFFFQRYREALGYLERAQELGSPEAGQWIELYQQKLKAAEK